MAKVKFGAMVTDARGKVDGVVFTKGPFGAVVRTKVSNINKRTPFQSVQRSITSRLMKRWGSVLSSAQRQAWDEAAHYHLLPDIFGNSQVVSGLNFYVRQNSLRLNGWSEFPDDGLFEGVEFIDVPPTSYIISVQPPLAASVKLVTLMGSAFRFEVQLDDAFDINGLEVMLHSTGPLPAGVNNFKDRLRLLTIFSSKAGGGMRWGDWGRASLFFPSLKSGDLVGVSLGVIEMNTGNFLFGASNKVFIE